MKFPGKMMAWLLLVALVSPLATGQVYVSPQAQPAGCHEHSQKVPATPVTYQCCRAGHQFAAVREAVNLRAPFMAVSRVAEIALSSSSEVVCRNQAGSPVLGSPGVTSLRI
jgi:hypothetical protein